MTEEEVKVLIQELRDELPEIHKKIHEEIDTKLSIIRKAAHEKLKKEMNDATKIEEEQE